MSRWPTAHGDANTWDTILLDCLAVAHNADGTIKGAVADPTTATGDLIYRDASGFLIRLPIGTAGQALVVAGSPALPNWTNLNPSAVPVGSLLSTLTLANSAVETQLCGGTVPANGFLLGASYLTRAYGSITNSASSPALTFRVKIGGTTIASVDFPSQGGAFSNTSFTLDGMSTVRTVGSFGNVGTFITLNWAGSAFVWASGAQAVNTTIGQVFEITAQWGSNLTGNSLSCGVAVIK